MAVAEALGAAAAAGGLEAHWELEVGPVARADSVVEMAVARLQPAPSQMTAMEVVAAGWVEGYSWKVGVWIYRDAAFRSILRRVVAAVAAAALEETAAAGSAVV